jgi:pyruvate/2-oxoglutarate/acetoin dehydrogenase E1 component
MRVIEAINGGLHRLMEKDPAMIILGEDIVDPYGGAFRATKGLSTAHPGRVWSMPISEAGMVGVATGLAVAGKPAIVELMFGDFITLAADALINHAAKFSWMYNDQVEVPIIVRTPMGGRRGYGPTHSQCLEKLFCGVPGLTVCAANEFSDPAALYERAHRARSPHLIIEDKVMYARPLRDPDALPDPSDADITLVSYGSALSLCAEAARRLKDEEEIETRVVPIEQLYPFPAAELRHALGRCGRVIVVEEAAGGWGFGAECAAALIGRVQHFRTLSGPDHPLPSSREWEEAVLPSVADIVSTAIDLFEAE